MLNISQSPHADHFPMNAHDQALERVKDLAMDGLSDEAIQSKLRASEFGGLLTAEEIEFATLEARAAQEVMPRHLSRAWPRVVGMIAAGMGIATIAFDYHSHSSIPFSKFLITELRNLIFTLFGVGDRLFGDAAIEITLGLILFFKPRFSTENME